jgi:hypothetical protein
MGAGLIENTESKLDFYKDENKNNDLEGVEDTEASELPGKKKKKRNKRKNKRKNRENESNASVIRGQAKNSTTNKFFGEDSAKRESIHIIEPDFTPLKQKLNDSFFEDQESSEDEGMPDYKLGGYHPIHVGEILIDRYVII